ncbi:MAG TPA: sulfotransferase [Nocardioides sp.]|uniref:sulfotransferase n=1 Tax=Nocardioides sp. TaxID=35761 RepID=UPI002E332438|nr:sulfotransferase [Nocardioides sp.]HEX5086457.1 sulfotransferase [Nocardioides sp.]
MTQVRRDELGFVFVVTYGRSGSTLLMGLLNTIPGYLIRGENWDALHHLFRFHRTLLEGSRKWEPARLRQRTHPFFGAGDFPARRSLEGIRALVIDTVLRPRDDTRVTGFKEIRWYQDDVEEYAAWLREVFPGARFVVNTRDHEEVLRSGWWAKRPEHAEALPAVEARIVALAEGLGDAAYRVHYNDYVANPSVLRGLFEWLGEPYDEERVRQVLATRHSV